MGVSRSCQLSAVSVMTSTANGSRFTPLFRNTPGTCRRSGRGHRRTCRTSSRMCWPRSFTLTAGRADLLDQPLEAVEIAVGVHRFAEAVGEDGHEVARFQRAMHGLVRRCRRPRRAAGRPSPRRPPRRYRHCDASSGAMWPAFTSDQPVRFRIDDRHDHRDELVLPIGVGEAGVDLLDGDRRIVLAGQQEPHVAREPRHQQGGRHAFAGHVADDHREPVVGQLDVVVVVAADLAGRLVVVEERVAGDLRRMRRATAPAASAGRDPGRARAPAGRATCSCILAFSSDTAAWLATPASTSRSSSVEAGSSGSACRSGSRPAARLRCRSSGRRSSSGWQNRRCSGPC